MVLTRSLQSCTTLRNMVVVGSPGKGRVLIISFAEGFMDEQWSEIPSILHSELELAQQHQDSVRPSAGAVVGKWACQSCGIPVREISILQTW